MRLQILLDAAHNTLNIRILALTWRYLQIQLLYSKHAGIALHHLPLQILSILYS